MDEISSSQCGSGARRGHAALEGKSSHAQEATKAQQHGTSFKHTKRPRFPQ